MERTLPSGVYVVFGLFTFLMSGTSVIQGLLVLYLISKFSFADGAAYSLYAAYASTIYASSLYGGYIGQRHMGQHNAIILGLILEFAGLISLTFSIKTVLLLGLCCFALGSGLIYPNVYCLLGRLYKPGDIGRDSAFTIAYTGMNFGSLIGFVTAGYLQRYFTFHSAFLFAVIIMTFGGILFIKNRKVFPSVTTENILQKRHNILGVVLTVSMIPLLFILLHYHTFWRWFIMLAGVSMVGFLVTNACLKKKTDPNAARKLFMLISLAILAMVFWSLYVLQPTVLILFLERNVDRSLFGTIPASSIMAFNPVYMLILGPALSYLWLSLDRKNKKISVPFKFSLALSILGLSFLSLSVGIHFANLQGYTSLIWIGVYFLFLSIAEMIIAPAGYAAIGTLVPEKMHSMMLGSWQLMVGAAVAFSGEIAQLVTTKPGVTQYPLLTNPVYFREFMRFGLVALSVGILSVIFMRSYSKITQIKLRPQLDI